MSTFKMRKEIPVSFEQRRREISENKTRLTNNLVLGLKTFDLSQEQRHTF